MEDSFNESLYQANCTLMNKQLFLSMVSHIINDYRYTIPTNVNVLGEYLNLFTSYGKACAFSDSAKKIQLLAEERKDAKLLTESTELSDKVSDEIEIITNLMELLRNQDSK